MYYEVFGRVTSEGKIVKMCDDILTALELAADDCHFFLTTQDIMSMIGESDTGSVNKVLMTLQFCGHIAGFELRRAEGTPDCPALVYVWGLSVHEHELAVGDIIPGGLSL